MNLPSEQVILASPLSFAGSAQHIWKITEYPKLKPLTATLAVLSIVTAWSLIVCWYCMWGIFLIPYRLLRRSNRKQKVTALQHKEVLAAIAKAK